MPRSAELTAWVVLLAALGGLGRLAPRLADALQALTEAAFVHASHPLSPVLLEAAQAVLWAVLPVLVALFVAALVAPMLLSGWVYAPRATQVDLTRAHPFKPLTRLFSADSLYDGLLALLKLALAVAAVGWALANGWPELQGLVDGEMNAALGATAAWVGRGVLALAAALAVAAALDAGWRWWRYLRRHAMTWQEVLAEAREAEAHPEVRAQLRGRRQQAGQGRRPHPNPPPQAGEGANVMPRTIDEVIG
ncbi:MAG: EscU/YscU/HrcU family type III secretion system export apparatus switch protein [Candidatus Thermoplasmatota archaeon]|nr:EscU/YscU/HrcU family type III secretion system export apparatus switch protein [Candidatus Thermoplasmatota archaeon]